MTKSNGPRFRIQTRIKGFRDMFHYHLQRDAWRTRLKWTKQTMHYDVWSVWKDSNTDIIDQSISRTIFLYIIIIETVKILGFLATFSMLSPCLPWEPGCKAQCWLGPSGTGFGHARLPSGESSLPQGAQSSHGADSPSAGADQQVEELQHTPYKEKRGIKWPSL